MKTVLLTGARGLVGSAVLRHFRENGWRAVVACSGTAQSLDPNITVMPFSLSAVAGDAALESAMAGVDAVVHCAALLPSGGLLKSPEGARQLYLLNSMGSYDLMEMAARHGVQSFVYISTANLYDQQVDIIEETLPTTVTDAYMLSKIACEDAAGMFSRITKTVFSGLRISAPYGAAFTVKSVIPIFVQRALSGEALELQGSGQRQQVFTYVGDIARACLMATSAKDSGVYNIAGPAPTSMAELARAVASAVGDPRVEVKFTGRLDPNEHARRRISLDRAREKLGWSPAYDLEKGLKAMIDEMRSPLPALLQTAAA